MSLANNRDLLFERIFADFGGTVTAETRTLALFATVLSWLIIIAYLWFRFHSLTYGLAAVIAVVHDVLVTLGTVAVSYWLVNVPIISNALMLEPFKIDLPMIAAFLTLIGFSVNDTIVIFDRIREIKGKTPYLTSTMVNDAINQTFEPDDPDLVDRLARGRGTLYIMGGEGLTLRVRAGRRLPRRDLQHGLYRHPDPDRLDRHEAEAVEGRPGICRRQGIRRRPRRMGLGHRRDVGYSSSAQSHDATQKDLRSPKGRQDRLTSHVSSRPSGSCSLMTLFRHFGGHPTTFATSSLDETVARIPGPLQQSVLKDLGCHGSRRRDPWHPPPVALSAGYRCSSLILTRVRITAMNCPGGSRGSIGHRRATRRA